MSEPNLVLLRDRQTGRSIVAILREALEPADIIHATAPWAEFSRERLRQWLAEGSPHSLWPEHSHWDWARKAAHYSGLRAYQFLGVECEGAIQGLILVSLEDKTCFLPEQAGKPLAYVHYLATAPWNDPDFTSTPRFGAVGSILIAAALQLSIDNGMQGRLGLHALPQAETFYGNHVGMTDLGVDADTEGLHYFEMSPEQASSYLHL